MHWVLHLNLMLQSMCFVIIIEQLFWLSIRIHGTALDNYPEFLIGTFQLTEEG